MRYVFTEQMLDEKAKKRPEGYKEAVLKAARAMPDGKYALDTESPEYKKHVMPLVPEEAMRESAADLMLKFQKNKEKIIQEKKEAAGPARNSIGIVEDIRPNLEAFEKLVPGLSAVVAEADSASCKGCARNRIPRKIESLFRLRALSEEQIEELRKLKAPENLISAARNEKPAPSSKQSALPPKPSARTLPVPQASGHFGFEVTPRHSCPSCVMKHLSQAWVLTDEILQGYPEHVRVALSHVQRAILHTKDIDSGVRKSLMSINSALALVLKLPPDGVEHHLIKAREKIGNLIATDPGRSQAYWKVVGHLGEAADECLEFDIALANTIRKERLRMMEEPDYTPDVETLLHKLKAKKDEVHDSGNVEQGAEQAGDGPAAVPGTEVPVQPA